mgnify:CR=1 FL=1
MIWNVLNSFGVDIKITRLLQNIYANSKAAVQVGRELGDWFGQSIGTRQGDPVSPAIFITYLERVMDACEDCRTGVNISGELIDNLRFADDIDLLEERSEDLQESLNGVAAAAEPYNGTEAEHCKDESDGFRGGTNDRACRNRKHRN